MDTQELIPSNIIKYAKSLGYVLTNEDCYDIMSTAVENETVQNAVNDYLDAYER